MRISDWSSDVCSSDLAESRYEHSGEGRRLHQILKGLLAVRLDAGDTLICENACGFRKELDRIEQAGGDDRLEVIDLELPLQGSQRYGGIIAHDREGYLLHHHGEHGIALARHNGGADRKSVVEGKSGPVGVDRGGRRINKK